MIKIGYRGESHDLFLHDVIKDVIHTSDDDVRVYVDFNTRFSEWYLLESILRDSFGFDIDSVRRTGRKMLERRLSSPVFRFNLTVIVYS
jgi:hypothetical protein